VITRLLPDPTVNSLTTIALAAILLKFAVMVLTPEVSAVVSFDDARQTVEPASAASAVE
jgi:hypothetical protein